jgi:hypothetical protein
MQYGCVTDIHGVCDGCKCEGAMDVSAVRM